MTINRDNYRQWAKKYGYGIIEENAESIFEGLEMKKEQFSVAYCPCVPPYMHKPELICPCEQVKSKSGDLGICHCGLFRWE